MNTPFLQNTNFLSRIGELSDRYIKVSSLDQAIEMIGSESWVIFTEECSGDLTEWLSKNHPKRYQGVWNKKVKEYKPIISKLIEDEFIPILKNDDQLITSLKWDILLIAMDESYEDLKKRPVWLSRIADCYRAGHLPCGIDPKSDKLYAY